MIKRFIPVLVLLASGCASLSKDQCQTVQWGALGERDAYEGYGRERLQSHHKACTEHGVSPDREAWMAGFDRGLQRFCLPQRGFDYGHGGGTYRDTCPVESDAPFRQGYRLGKALHDEESAKSSLESRIRETERKLKKAGSDEERAKLRRQLADLDNDRIERNRNLRRLDDDIRQAGLAR